MAKRRQYLMRGLLATALVVVAAAGERRNRQAGNDAARGPRPAAAFHGAGRNGRGSPVNAGTGDLP